MANITKMYLLNVPLEPDYNHTLYFTNRADQQAYFQSRLVKSYTDFSYQRKDNLIRVPEVYDNLIGCNYVMYQNTAQSNKWYYAFITHMQYVNEGMTEVYIETDVFQTWMFNVDGSRGFVVKPSFVEREHVDSDIMGEHTVPEQVELGDYICNYYNKAGYSGERDMRIVVGVTKDPNGENVRGTLYNNIYSGVNYYVFPNTLDGRTQLENWISEYASDGAAESIVCMFLAPSKLVALRDDNTIAGTNYTSKWYINTSTAGEINTNITVTDHRFKGYSPRNKKLMCYPYRCLMVSNNSGGAATYKYEQFYEMNDVQKIFIHPKFKIEGCLTPGCSVRMIPMNYNGIQENHEEALNLGKFPVLNWTSDVYTNWLTQNGVNIAVSLGTSVMQIAGGVGMAMTGVGAVAGGGMVTSGVLGAASSIGEIYSHSLQPPQAQGNLNNGDVITASGDNDFHFYDMTIKEEYARIIDGYFDMFGYKVNKVKIPSVGHRLNYWYTKTIDVNIDGAIPSGDLQKIKDTYNRGFTFWIDPANIGNYSVDNVVTG